MATALTKLDLNMNDQAFMAGAKAAASILNDPMKLGSSEPDWDDAFMHPGQIDGVLLVAGSDPDICSSKLQKMQSILDSTITEVTQIQGKVRPGAMKGHEHFGFLDGVSQPAVQGVDQNVSPGQDTISPGVILCGRAGDNTTRPEWMTDGSFMCFRKLAQRVPEWNKFLVDASNQLGTWSDQLGARLMGRWKSGM